MWWIRPLPSGGGEEVKKGVKNRPDIPSHQPVPLSSGVDLVGLIEGADPGDSIEKKGGERNSMSVGRTSKERTELSCILLSEAGRRLHGHESHLGRRRFSRDGGQDSVEV
jgi:hypothetical protein